MAGRLAAMVCFVAGVWGGAAFAASGSEAALRLLGPLTEGNRFNAIASMSRAGQFRAPMRSDEVAAVLQATTGTSRSMAISELASVIKADVSGREAMEILGPESVLSEGYRHYAIAALARAGRIGPSMAEDAELALRGTTGSSRSMAIAEISTYLRSEMPGTAIAAILGSDAVLNESNRANAISALARAGRIQSRLSSADGSAVLRGTSQVARQLAVGELARFFKGDLSGQEADIILGSETNLVEGYRSNAIASLARAGRFGPSLGEDAALALKGTSGASRMSAISELAAHLRRDLPGSVIAKILGPEVVLNEGYRANAIAALARAGRIRMPLPTSEAQLVLAGTTGSARSLALQELTSVTGLHMPPAATAGAWPLPPANTGLGTAGSTPIAAPTPALKLVTACGPSSGNAAYRFGVRLFLQDIEIYQAHTNGVSFNAACEGHDACYGAVGSAATRLYCDNEFERIAAQICAGASSDKAACLRQKDAFYVALRRRGQSAFCSARGLQANCAKSD